MDSKTSSRALPKHHQKTAGIQTLEAKDTGSSLQKGEKTELAAPVDLSMYAANASKQNTGETAEIKKLGGLTLKGSADSMSIKSGSGASSSVLDKVVHAANENIGSQESSIDLDKKTSEDGSVKNSSVSAKVSDGASSLAKTSGSAKISNRADFVESGKSSICRGSTSSDVSDESTCSSFSSSINKPHKANDLRWEAIQAVRSRDGVLGLGHFRLLKRLGCGDIGSVYLSELSGTKCYFAMKVMDKGSLASRKKLLRAQTEREILQSLDHPFLPTLYTHFETEKFSCLVMEFCPGGDLHTLRQKQPGKHFPEQAVKYVLKLSFSSVILIYNTRCISPFEFPPEHYYLCENWIQFQIQCFTGLLESTGKEARFESVSQGVQLQHLYLYFTFLKFFLGIPSNINVGSCSGIILVCAPIYPYCSICCTILKQRNSNT